MNTKEAIKIIEYYKTAAEILPSHRSKELSEVITLLKRGEAYEKMWGELDPTFKDGCFEDIRDIYHHIKQKYLPKEES